MAAKRRQARPPDRAAETDYERDEAVKDFILSCPLLPTDEAGRWALYFEAEGYREVSVRQVGLGCWRVKAKPPVNRTCDEDAKRDARRIVRKMGRKLLSPGVGARVGTRWATFVILLIPEGGIFPANEELLPERYRQAPPEDVADYM